MWDQICVDKENIDSDADSTTDGNSKNKDEAVLREVIEKSDSGTPPMISVILSMPTHLVEQILEYQVTWVQSTGWRPEYGAWLYSLLTRIEKPLTPDMGSILRDLALFCSQERSKLVKLISENKSQTTSNQDK